MNYNENRLQFVHCDNLFVTAEDAKKYVMGNLETIQRPSLYAEPMVLKYGDEKNPNIILAIGSVGDGETQSMDNRTFFIDFAKVENDINEIIETTGTNKELIENLDAIIKKMIVSCGLKEDGSYDSDSVKNDAVLANSKSLFEADKLLSEYVVSLEKRHTLNVEETPSVQLELSKDSETGMLLKGSVKLAESKTVDKTVLDNQLLVEQDGLFYNVDFVYNNEDSKAVFSVNGVKKEYDLPKETFLVDGKYDADTESLVLSLNREVEYNGKVIKDITIDLKSLIGEWGVLPVDAQSSPIVLTKSAVTSEDVLHGATLTQDILSADVRIAPTDLVPDNILEKDATGRYLAVRGTAKNISYWDKAGNKITVDEALNNVKCNVSTHVGNIIVEKTDGLYASVSLDYDVASNTLKFNDGVNTAKEIKLNSAEFIDDVSYDSSKEVIKIRFKLADGTTNIIEIPVGDILEEWEVDNTNTTVTLTKVRNSGSGKDTLSANVNIANNSDDNILTVKGNALYVKGVADNIRYKETTVASELDTIKYSVASEIETRKAADDALTTSLTKEVTDRIAADEEIKNSVKSEEIRAIAEEARIEHLVNDNKSAIESNSSAISNIQTTVDSFDNRIQAVEAGFETVKTDVEKAVEEANAMADKVQANAEAITAESERAKLAEQSNASAIAQEKQRAEAAENTNTTAIEVEKNRAETAEGELRNAVNANLTTISQISSKLEEEISRAKAKEEELVSADASLSERLTNEVTRATGVETELSNKLTAEITRSTSTDEQIIAKVDINTSDIAKETLRATTKEDEIANSVDVLNGALVSEVERAKVAEQELSERIKSNADAITILNGSVETAGSVREIVSHAQADVEAKLTNEINRATGVESSLQTQIDELKLNVNDGNAQTLADAKAYTDAEVAKHVVDTTNAIATAKREAIDAAASDATTKADAALESAKAYTDTEVEKHKVSTDNAIATAKQEAISTASDDATAKSTQALTDAKAHADSEIALATERLNVVITDAKREAIDAAASDATTKADAALESAKAYTDAEKTRAEGIESGLQSQIDNLVAKDSELVTELAKKIEKVEVIKNSASDLQYTLYVDGVPAGDINIPKDQFLQDVTYNSISKELTFLFETSDGVKTQVINIADLIDTYVAGDGLTLTDNVFSVKKDSASESYLEVSADGIKVVGIDAALEAKANVSDVYTKEESDAKYLTEHQDISSLATKEEVNVVASDLTTLSETVQGHTNAISIINGNEATDGSIAKALKDAKAYADEKVSAETSRAESAEKINSDAIAIINGNESTDGSIKKALADANAYTDAQISTLKTSVDNSIAAEVSRATSVENSLQSAVDVINGNESTDGSIKKALADANAYTDSGLAAEKIRAEAAEKVNADAISVINGNEATDGSIAKALKDAKAYADTQIQNEATVRSNADNELDAKIATKANASDVYTKAEIDAKNFVVQGDISGFATTEQVNAVDEKVNANITAIATKANASDVYTKVESDDKFLTKSDAKDTYATITKLDETNAQVNQNKADIVTLNNTVDSMKFDVADTDTVGLTMASSTNGKALSANIKVGQNEGNIIKIGGTGIYANVTFDYNKATNTITFNDGNGAKSYELSMHSLVTDGYFDAETKQIVLVIETADGTKHAYIPVADLVNDFNVENSDNNPIKLYKSVGTDGVNVLSASVAISTEPNNLVLNNNGTLFASKRAEDHTAIVNGETVTVQKAITDLENGLTAANTNITNIQTELTTINSDIDTLEDKVSDNELAIATVQGQITSLTTIVTAMQEKVGLIEQTVNDYTAQIEAIKEIVGEPVEGQPTVLERLATIEEIVNNLIDFGQYQNTF